MAKNFLYYGDNLAILRDKIESATVDLCYIDPPFNSKRNYNQIYNRVGREDLAQAQAFVDTWTWDDLAIAGFAEILANKRGRFQPALVELTKGLHAFLREDSLLAYLVSMSLRITEIHRVLKPTGTFFLHCDPTASHYLKLLLDAIFGPENFRNELIWHYKFRMMDSDRIFNRKHDVLLFYAKSRAAKLDMSAVVEPWTRDEIIRTRKQAIYKDETGREWIWMPGPRGRSKNKKKYLDEIMAEGKALDDVWDIPTISSSAKERMGYPTQKPEALLERVIAAGSEEGALVLDAYCGCGTSVAVAQRLKRRWIGMDITYQSISLILRRIEQTFTAAALEDIVSDGIPQDMESARALAHKRDDRLRKEFEKWAVLTYTNNRAVINEKKGADAGIDGTAFFQTGRNDNAKIVFQVKSGGVERGDIAKLRGDMGREGAALAVLITLEAPKGPMLKEAKAAGQYVHETMGRSYDKISIVTVQEIVEDGRRLEMPMSLDPLPATRRAADAEQVDLLRESASEAGVYHLDSAPPLRKAAEPEPEGYPSKPKRNRTDSS